MAKTKKKATKKKAPRRKKFKVETVTLKLSDALGYPSDLDDLRDEMTEWRDNLEDTLSHTDKYQAVSDAADALESICSEMESACEALLEALKDHPILTVEIECSTRRPYGRTPARWLRLENATSPIRDALQKVCAEIPRPTKGEETKENEIYEALDDVESQLDDCSNIEFPGMYG